MKLTLELEQEIELLKKYGLTPTELFFIRVLLILQKDDNEKPLYLPKPSDMTIKAPIRRRDGAKL